MKNNIFFFTNDVETTSLKYHKLSLKTGEKVLKEGMPILLDLYKKYDIKSTFFFTGNIAKHFPEVVRMVIPYGHEVACHGLYHTVESAFDILSLEEQKRHLETAKKILEDISGQEVISFRAPALRVNNHTPQALIETGFKIDSSIAPQRGDFIFSFGLKNKLKWISANRRIYYTSYEDLSKKGKSILLEIPINAYLLPYIGTFMRISPLITKLIRELVFWESNFFFHSPVFIIHPNEFINEEGKVEKIRKRGNNLISYIFGDILRHKLKLKNLGTKALPLFEEQIKYFYKKNFKFITMKEFYYNFQQSGGL